NDGADQDHMSHNIPDNMPSGTCSNASGNLGGGGGSPPTPQEIQLSQQCQNNINTRTVPGNPLICTGQPGQPLACKEVLANPPQANPAHPNSCGAAGNAACDFQNCQAIADDIQSKSSSVTNNFTQGDCAVKYIFDTPLDSVEVATYNRKKETNPVGTGTVGP